MELIAAPMMQGSVFWEGAAHVLLFQLDLFPFVTMADVYQISG
jgi:hypothetical protein